MRPALRLLRVVTGLDHPIEILIPRRAKVFKAARIWLLILAVFFTVRVRWARSSIEKTCGQVAKEGIQIRDATEERLRDQGMRVIRTSSTAEKPREQWMLIDGFAFARWICSFELDDEGTVLSERVSYLD